MAQKFTKEMQRLVIRTDKNTRGIAKIVSAMQYLPEIPGASSANVFESMSELDQCVRALVEERRKFRAGLEAELSKQAGWRK